jgi:AcrR family transcriptional regulator
MKRPTKRELKYEAIYSAALKVFAEYGFKKTTIADIAAELDTAKSALYFYVKDKRELYDQAVAYGLRRWQNKVRDAVAAETDVVEQFTVMAHKAYEYLAQDRHLQRILMRDPALFPLYPSQDPYSDINRDSIAMLKAIITRGIAAGRFRPVDIDGVAPLMFSFYVMLIQKTYMFPEGELSHIMFRDAIDLILKGLIAPDKSQQNRAKAKHRPAKA